PSRRADPSCRPEERSDQGSALWTTPEQILRFAQDDKFPSSWREQRKRISLFNHGGQLLPVILRSAATKDLLSGPCRSRSFASLRMTTLRHPEERSDEGSAPR